MTIQICGHRVGIRLGISQPRKEHWNRNLVWWKWWLSVSSSRRCCTSNSFLSRETGARFWKNEMKSQRRKNKQPEWVALTIPRKQRHQHPGDSHLANRHYRGSLQCKVDSCDGTSGLQWAVQLLLGIVPLAHHRCRSTSGEYKYRIRWQFSWMKLKAPFFFLKKWINLYRGSLDETIEFQFIRLISLYFFFTKYFYLFTYSIFDIAVKFPGPCCSRSSNHSSKRKLLLPLSCS